MALRNYYRDRGNYDQRRGDALTIMDDRRRRRTEDMLAYARAQNEPSMYRAQTERKQWENPDWREHAVNLAGQPYLADRTRAGTEQEVARYGMTGTAHRRAMQMAGLPYGADKYRAVTERMRYERPDFAQQDINLIDAQNRPSIMAQQEAARQGAFGRTDKGLMHERQMAGMPGLRGQVEAYRQSRVDPMLEKLLSDPNVDPKYKQMFYLQAMGGQLKPRGERLAGKFGEWITGEPYSEYDFPGDGTPRRRSNIPGSNETMSVNEPIQYPNDLGTKMLDWQKEQEKKRTEPRRTKRYEPPETRPYGYGNVY